MFNDEGIVNISTSGDGMAGKIAYGFSFDCAI